jgi:hypothetical protein
VTVPVRHGRRRPEGRGRRYLLQGGNAADDEFGVPFTELIERV